MKKINGGDSRRMSSDVKTKKINGEDSKLMNKDVNRTSKIVSDDKKKNIETINKVCMRDRVRNI